MLSKCNIVEWDNDVRNSAGYFEKIELDYQDKSYSYAFFYTFG